MQRAIDTRQVVVDVPLEQLNAFVQYIKSKHFQMFVTEDLNIPKEHMDLARERMAASTPESLHNWDEIKDSFKLD